MRRINVVISDMTTKPIVLITGATGSIGGGAAVALAKRGAHVVLLGRNPDKLNASVKRITDKASTDGQTPEISTLLIDLSDMDSVRRAAENALRQFPAIDSLILSAAAFIENGPNILPSGHEAMFATNVMGPFLLTQLLSKRLQESDGLVLHVIAPFYRKVDWDDLESVRNHKTFTAFGRTKTCNRAIAGELARRYEGRLASVAFDPTSIKPEPGVESQRISGLFGVVIRLVFMIFARPPSAAGESIANLILSSQDRSSLNGAMYVLDKRSSKVDRAMNDLALGKRLWEELERHTGLTSD